MREIERERMKIHVRFKSILITKIIIIYKNILIHIISLITLGKMKIKFVNNSIHIKNLSIYYDLFDSKGEKILLVPLNI